MEIKIDLDYRSVEKALAYLGNRSIIDGILVRGVNEATKVVRSLAADRAAEIYNLSKKQINAKLKRNVAKPGKIEGKMTIKRTPFPLMEFGPVQGPRGVNVVVERGRAELLPSAFIATMKSGKTGVFVRKSAIGPTTRKYMLKPPRGPVRRKNGSELPIALLNVDPLSKVLKDKAIEFQLLASKVAIDSIDKEVQSLIDRFSSEII